ncbi:MAG: hypothetical protein Q9179_000922 [Wetmoreana sp. 5 TL-2023]
MKLCYPEALLLFAVSLVKSTIALPTINDAPVRLQRRYDRAAIAAYEFSGAHWTTQVTIGSQVLNLMVDTGSADLPYVKDPGDHVLYNYTKSPHSEPMFDVPIGGGRHTPETFDIQYGFKNSRVRGFVVSDSVSIGATPPVWMAVEVATEVATPFKNMVGVDGIIGLGFQRLNRVTPSLVVPFMNRLIDGTAPTLPVFTVDFGPQRLGSKPTVEIGKIDPQKASGTLQHAHVNNKDGWWAVDDISFEVNGTSIPTTQTMVFDTGGSGIVTVHPDVALAYYSHVGGAQDLGINGSYYFPCSSDMVDMKLHIGSGSAVYKATQLKAGTSTPGLCTGIIRGTAPDMGNVGAAFFKAHYVVFDYKEPAIQYAPHA